MNPKTKVYENGVISTRFNQKRNKAGRFDSFKAKCKRAGIYAVRALIIVTILYGTYVLGAATYSTDNITIANAETKFVVTDTEAPILQRISDCESGNGKPGTASQTRNGQTLIHINAAGLGYDQGIMQINSSWNATAASMGYDLSKEADNKAFGKWLYENKGTSPWSSSQSCWSR